MFLRKLFRDRRGAAAVEFAFVAPVMIFLYYGLAELTQAMMADRKTAHVASAIGDLVSQDTTVTASEMSDIFNVGKAIIAPFPNATLTMRVTSVRADAGGTPQVVWSKASGTLTPLTTATVPTGLIAANESVIMAESGYTYTSSVQKALPNALVFTEKKFFKPRKTSQVLYSAT